MPPNKDTLCWLCDKVLPGNGCDWSSLLIPVEGWVAEEKNIRANGKYSHTYCVHECPLFEMASKLVGKECKQCNRFKKCRKKKFGVCADYTEAMTRD